MTLKTQIILLIVLIIYFSILIYTVKHRGLLLKYAILWICAGIVLFVFWGKVTWFTAIVNFLGIKDTMNGLFLLLIGCLAVLLLSVTIIASRQAMQIKRLVQRVSILENRLEKGQTNA